MFALVSKEYLTDNEQERIRNSTSIEIKVDGAASGYSFFDVDGRLTDDAFYYIMNKGTNMMAIPLFETDRYVPTFLSDTWYPAFLSFRGRTPMELLDEKYPPLVFAKRTLVDSVPVLYICMSGYVKMTFSEFFARLEAGTGDDYYSQNSDNVMPLHMSLFSHLYFVQTDALMALTTSIRTELEFMGTPSLPYRHFKIVKKIKDGKLIKFKKPCAQVDIGMCEAAKDEFGNELCRLVPVGQLIQESQIQLARPVSGGIGLGNACVAKADQRGVPYASAREALGDTESLVYDFSAAAKVVTEELANMTTVTHDKFVVLDVIRGRIFSSQFYNLRGFLQPVRSKGGEAAQALPMYVENTRAIYRSYILDDSWVAHELVTSASSQYRRTFKKPFVEGTTFGMYIDPPINPQDEFSTAAVFPRDADESILEELYASVNSTGRKPSLVIGGRAYEIARVTKYPSPTASTSIGHPAYSFEVQNDRALSQLTKREVVCKVLGL